MFCPKCGSQNVEKSKFCRGCGADLGDVTALVAGKPPARSLAEKHIDLYSRGVRGLLLGLGFLIVSGLGFVLSTRGPAFSLFALMFAFVFLATGISRFVQARGLKALDMKDEPAALPPGQMDYIKPSRSIYETDDLVPASVTEHTTTNLSQKQE